MPNSNHNLGRRRLLQGVAASWLLSVSRVGVAASSHVIAVRVWPSSTYTRVTLESNVELKYKQFALTNPDRVVVDIEGVQLNSVLKGIVGQVRDDDPYLKQARVGEATGIQYGGCGDPSGKMTRHYSLHDRGVAENAGGLD